MTLESSSEVPISDDERRTRHTFVDSARSRFVQFRLWVGLSTGGDETHNCYFRPDPWTVPEPVLQFESATSVDVQQVRVLDDEIEELITIATEESIEDGMESETEARLGRFVASHSILGVHRLSARLNSGCINVGTAADIVRVLGQFEHKETHDERLWIAARMLRAGTAVARDASAIALEELGDPRALGILQEAVSVEAVPELRADLEMALGELKKITDGVHSPKA